MRPSPRADRVRRATTSAAWLHVMIRALEAQGHDGARMALEAGIPSRSLAQPSERVPQLAMTRLWKAAVAATGNPCLGLEVARFASGSTFGALVHAVLVSPTLEDALGRIVRFQRLMSDALGLELSRGRERYRLTLRPISPEHPPVEVLDAFFANCVRMVRGLAAVDPLCVHMRRAPVQPELFERVFRAPVRFRAPSDFVEYAAVDCQQRLSDANPELAREYDRILSRHAARLGASTLIDQVRELLLETLPDGPAEPVVARRLGLSRSSLKAKLAREATSYRAILDEVREDLARAYLQEPAYSIKEIAFLLGYSETAAFSRAFRRWTGRSPSEIRAGGDRNEGAS